MGLTDRPIFVFGTLRDLDLLSIVLGRDLKPEPAMLTGWRIARAKGQSFPILAEEEAGSAEGLLLSHLKADEIARLDYYEAPYDYTLQPVEVIAAGEVVSAAVYMPPENLWQPAKDWSLTNWQANHGSLMREAAVEIMDSFGTEFADGIAARIPVIRSRAQQKVNARKHPSPVKLRRPHSRDDVDLLAKRRKYSHFFALDEVDIRYAKFTGEKSAPVERAVFLTADAVTVLPYDPKRDRVMLIEQFRASPYIRGDLNPWSLEVIAGRNDPGEAVEDTARREAVEEAGITIGALHQVGRYYVSLGSNTEYLTSFIGVADLPDGSEGIGGLEVEAEDIRSLLISFEELMEAVQSGEAENAPLILSALWLARMRDELRANA